jgi:hypothetical protein
LATAEHALPPDRVGNVYNRLVLFDALFAHGASA